MANPGIIALHIDQVFFQTMNVEKSRRVESECNNMQILIFTFQIV